MDDGFAFFQTQLLQHAVHPVCAENTHQIIFEAQVEFGAPWIALTTSTATQLIVDAAAFMSLGANDVEAACVQGLLFLGSNVCFDFCGACRTRRIIQAFVDFVGEAHFQIAA